MRYKKDCFEGACNPPILDYAAMFYMHYIIFKLLFLFLLQCSDKARRCVQSTQIKLTLYTHIYFACIHSASNTHTHTLTYIA